jgi:hypothetical protein
MGVHRLGTGGTLEPDGGGTLVQSVETRSPTIPIILGIVGGVFLAVGSFLNWASVSVNVDKIAAAIGIDPTQIPAEIRAQGTASVTGWDIGQGKWTLVTGIVVIIASALLVIASSQQVVALVVIFGGAVGGSMALYEATVGKDHRLNEVAGIFTSVALPGSLSQYFSISIGIGLRLCALGGLLAIVAGILAMSRRGPSTSAEPSATPPSPSS